MQVALRFGAIHILKPPHNRTYVEKTAETAQLKRQRVQMTTTCQGQFLSALTADPFFETHALENPRPWVAEPDSEGDYVVISDVRNHRFAFDEDLTDFNAFKAQYEAVHGKRYRTCYSGSVQIDVEDNRAIVDAFLRKARVEDRRIDEWGES